MITESFRGPIHRAVWGVASAALTIASSLALAGESASLQDEHEVVGSMTLEAPQETTFVLHGTLPVPPGTWSPGDEGSPLSVLQPDGSQAVTQVEAVSLDPDRTRGAHVLEVIARVQRPPGVLPGSPISYKVALYDQSSGKHELHPQVAQLLEGAGGLPLSTRDVLGNRYEADLTLGSPLRVGREGPLVREVSRHQVLLPESSKPKAKALPHMMGVHSHLRTHAQAGYILLDLHLHNGMDGLDKLDPRDDALREIYFSHLSLELPPGWKVLHAFDNPAAGRSLEGDGVEQHLLLEPQEDGTMYLMPRQSHLVRRLAITLPGWESRARSALESRHLAFCRRGQNEQGRRFWSWWNPATAHYFPQRYPLPDLDHVGLEELRSSLDATAEARIEQIASGDPGTYPMYSAALGWAQPWGVPYGGMTGGDEIHPISGLRVAASASRGGYRLAQIGMRGYVDRQPTALYSRSGRPTRVEDILESDAGTPHVTSTFYLVPKTGDPFGFSEASDHQTIIVLRDGLAPEWQDELLSYGPIDFQHYIRHTRNLKVLAWLGNDSLARAELEAAAELFHLSFHEFPYGKYGYVESTGLLAKMELVNLDPGEGLPTGRGDAWGLDAVAAAYSLGSVEFRDRTYPWIEKVVRTFEAGQSECTGNLQALYVGKLLGGQFLVSRSNECSYLENALRGLNESLFAGRDEELFKTVRDMLVASVRAQTRPPFWNETELAPWATVGVAPADPLLPEFCKDVPEGAFGGYANDIHLWSSLGYAYLYTGEPHFLKRAQEMAGSASLWAKLHEDGLDWIENRSALLSVVQALHAHR